VSIIFLGLGRCDITHLGWRDPWLEGRLFHISQPP
jgi:hypothetical protein